MADPFTDWINPMTGRSYYSQFVGGGGGFDSSFFTKKSKAPSLSEQIQTQQGVLRKKAGDIESEERRRYDLGIGNAIRSYNETDAALSKLIDPDLVFSQAADAIGARSAGNLEALRGSLGARGLSPNSGAAQGMLGRLAFQQSNAVTGAIRDTELETQKQRQVNSALRFANALQLTNAINAPVSGIGYEAEQDVLEGMLSQYGADKVAKAQKKASSNSLIGDVIGGAASFLGGLF